MNQPWWQKGVIYQIYPRSFKDTTGDGVGDLKGITEKLGYLEWLGVDALWLSPMFPSPMRDFGYDVTDYKGIDPLFGTLADFDTFVEAAHARNLKVILDVVPNHSSDEHPWFAESRSSLSNPKRDWYIWREAKADGSPPNNWRGADALDTPGSVWRFDETTGRYYLGSFSPFQTDLNWANPEVRETMSDALRFWLERGVDGFRIDMVDFLGKDPEMRDEPPETAEAEDYLVTAKYQLGRPETHHYIRELRRTIHAYPERVMIGEVLHFLSPRQLERFYGEGDELDLPFHFGLAFLPMEAEPLRARVGAYEAALSEEHWPNYNLANHDMPRLAQHGEAARLAAMLLLSLRGTPFLYYGDELGMANMDVPPERQQDPFVIYQTGTSRDGVRTPMQWSAEAHAGFSDVEPWLPVAKNFERVNVEAGKGDEASVLWFYRRLLELRRAEPALQAGSYGPVEDVPEGCFAFLREYGGREVLVALNFTEDAQTLRLPQETSWQITLSTLLDWEGAVTGALALRPYEGVVLC